MIYPSTDQIRVRLLPKQKEVIRKKAFEKKLTMSDLILFSLEKTEGIKANKLHYID